MANFFLANVKNEDMLAPKNVLAGGTGNHAYETMLEKLAGYSQQEARLLRLGLRTPVIRSRLMTLKRLRVWKDNGEITEALQRAIDEWKKNETDQKMRFEYLDL